jgi:AraC-like DNA-binding protein
VQDYIRSSLPTGNCTIERCAQKMDMSVRTLQAKLSESELSFSDLLEEQRIALAQSYLKQQHLSLDDVANNLGYSEQSSFGRAFKRWTGQTPKQFRQKRPAS